MTMKDETVRRRSVANFRAAVDQMTQDVAELLRADETLPDLRITSAEYAAGRWLFPVEYRPIIEHTMVQLITQTL